MKSLLFLALIVFIESIAHAQSNTADYKVSFKVQPATLTCPGEVTISWNVIGLEKISITGIGDDLPLQGSARQFVKNTETFILSGTYISKKESRIIKRKASVYVDTLQPQLNLVYYPTQIREGATVSIQWDAQNTKKFYLEMPENRELPLQGVETFTLNKPAKFVFALINGCNEPVRVEKNFLVIPADTVKIPSKANEQEPVKLSWRIGLADSVKILEIPGKTFKPKEQISYIPLDNITFHLIAYRNTGKIDTFKYSMLVIPKQEEKNIVFFSSSQFKIKVGQPVKLAWEVKNADNLYIVGMNEKLPLKGSLEVFPTQPTDYILCAELGNKKEFASVNVNVVKRNNIKNKINYSNLSSKAEIEMDIIHVDRSDYPNKIKIGVLAYDSIGNFISGLADNNNGQKFFKKVIERVDGIETEAKDFTVREIHEQISKPYDIGLVLDYSGSMGIINIKFMEKAVRKLIELKKSNDRISMTKFDSRIKTYFKFTANKQVLLNKQYYDDYYNNWGGATALYAGIDEGLCLMDSFATQQKMLIVFTDGYENSSGFYAGRRLVNPIQLLNKARALGVRLHFVSLGNSVDRNLLQAMANVGDGYYYSIQSHLEIEEIMSEIPRVMRTYYEIEYTPVKKTGGRSIELVYDNNKGEEKNTVRDQVYTSNDFTDIKELNEIETKFPYVISEFNGKKPTSSPQAIAFFDFDDDVLQPQYVPTLQSYVEQLRNDRQAVVVIYGHTDLVGSDAYCMKLSERRANTIREFFLQHGVDASRIMVKPCGKKYPIHPMEIQDWQARENRRIELVLYQ
ncbi:MAG: VWA domain-containing protein [Flavobacteriales bacterium]|nr:VWA domain-containing protein [Flavobacteriales bacterium]